MSLLPSRDVCTRSHTRAQRPPKARKRAREAPSCHLVSLLPPRGKGVRLCQMRLQSLQAGTSLCRHLLQDPQIPCQPLTLALLSRLRARTLLSR